MNIGTIENIYSEFCSTNIDQYDLVIDIYEKNSIFFNNIKHFKDKEELSLYIFMVGRYIDAVFHKDRYNLTIDLSDQHLVIIDSEIQRLNATEIKNTWYKSISFNKGMASYKLKDYNTAALIFKKFVQLDNQNDNYKSWLNYAQYGQRIWIARTINIICMLLFVVDIFVQKLIPSPLVGLWIIGIAFIGLTLTTGYDYYIRRSFRKTTKN